MQIRLSCANVETDCSKIKASQVNSVDVRVFQVPELIYVFHVNLGWKMKLLHENFWMRQECNVVQCVAWVTDRKASQETRKRFLCSPTPSPTTQNPYSLADLRREYREPLSRHESWNNVRTAIRATLFQSRGIRMFNGSKRKLLY